MLQRPVFRIGNVPNTEQTFNLHPAFVSHRDIAVLFVHHKIAGKLRRFPGCDFEFFALLQLGNNAVDLVILVGRLFTGAGNNQRRAGFVNQDGIMAWTFGISALITRSFLVPKTLPKS